MVRIQRVVGTDRSSGIYIGSGTTLVRGRVSPNQHRVSFNVREGSFPR